MAKFELVKVEIKKLLPSPFRDAMVDPSLDEVTKRVIEICENDGETIHELGMKLADFAPR